MITAFISDLHLEPNQPIITDLLVNFLNRSVGPDSPFDEPIETLYILGDLFEMWIGDDHHTPLNDHIIAALKTFSTQAKLFVMPGNRDFLFGKRFALACGATLLDDPTLIDLYGNQTLLMHGDSLCTQDLTYQRFRRMVRSPRFSRWFLKLPLRWRIAIGRKMRANSTQRNQKIDSALMDINLAELPAVMKSFNTHEIIYGHTHRPMIEAVTDKQYRYVLSDWHKNGNGKGNVLICRPNGKKELIYFDEQMNLTQDSAPH